MRPSLARYLAVLVTLTFAINVVINDVLGRLLLPDGKRVPFDGPTGIKNDTIANCFVIALLTVVATFPGAKREAWAGRVRGFGMSALDWPSRNVWKTAFGIGLLSALLLPHLLFAFFAHKGFRIDDPSFDLDKPYYVVLKAMFAGIVGSIVAVFGALLAIAPEPDVSGDSRWLHDPKSAPQPVYPCDYFDKGALSVSDNTKGCSGTPTWQLLVKGTLDATHVRAALADVVTRYPSLATKVRAIDGVPPWASRYVYAHDPAFKLDDIFRVADLRANHDGLAAFIRDEINRPLDLFADFPVTLTLAVTSDDSCRLFFRQHHAIADGRAFIGLLKDFALYLEAARNGRRPTMEELVPIGRSGDLSALDLTPVRAVADTFAGLSWLLRKWIRNTVTPLTPLMQNLNGNYIGENGTLHWVVPESALEGWNAARKGMNVSLNSLLTGALFAANARWHKDMNQPLGRAVATLMVETRPRDRPFVSFANHLAMHEVSLRLDRLASPAEAMKFVDVEVRSQRLERVPIKRLLGERIGVLLLPLGDMRRIVFESKRVTSNVDFSNLIALAFPTLAGEGWNIEEVHITTTVTPRNGIILTVIHYNGRLTFNFNYKASAATRDQTRQLAERFVAVMKETTGVAVEGEWL